MESSSSSSSSSCASSSVAAAGNRGGVREGWTESAASKLLGEECDRREMERGRDFTTFVDQGEAGKAQEGGVVSEPQRPEKGCWICDKVGKGLQTCNHYGVARYCSKECQRTGWKGGHKKECKSLASSRSALEAETAGGMLMSSLLEKLNQE
uniref:MYND-type domain-containing protein n=1 Tax=Chromera velia CCMP2878 TaxID=1169474 RepID=A0A0G4HSY4_9ALVE|eukprot:Cvel_8367.t1-p1 / transcript=Cvel_8367.t1 / gene=Cvel_8367 / organism=Chromera_velia_CCMP2878 / gene_product=hypothetical protein / transcript_product=hypothetical protein / location=Cvel_scaffold461:22508-22960(-) / protein_length=151 / sequence_SO=supercontig / SO=protein_coding / is_pseudo=false